MKRKTISLFILLALLFSLGQSTVLAVPTRATEIYYAARVWSDADMQFLAQSGVTHIEVRLNVNASPATEWKAVIDRAEKYKLKVVVWPSDWNHPRPKTVCNHESPFPVTIDGDISRILPLLDYLVTRPNVVGIITAHEPTSNCKMTVKELAGIRAKILDYTTQKGRAIPIWVYGGNLGTTSYWTNEAIQTTMDYLIQWKACAGRVNPSCADIPGRILFDRKRIAEAGMEGKVKAVFLIQTYTADYAPYDKRLSYDELVYLSCYLTNTNTIDGYGFYLWSADWYSGDLQRWKDVWGVVPEIHNACLRSPLYPQLVPSITKAAQTVTPVSTMPGATWTASAPTKTPIVTQISPTAIRTRTPLPSFTPTIGTLPGECKPYSTGLICYITFTPTP